MISLKMKIVSAMEKCFYNDAVESKREKNEFLIFRNERLSFQVVYSAELSEKRGTSPAWHPVRLEGELAKYASVRLVTNVLNMYPTYGENPGGEFITTEPGAYPDLICPLLFPDAIALPHGQTHALWVEVELPKDFAAGKYDLSLSIMDRKGQETLGKVTASVQVLGAELPPQTLIHTEWFYTDCIANYYHVKPFSEKHWKLIANFIRTATKNGINMILTPVFTPELDTYVGGERLTTQLVEIEQIEKGKYAFGFEKLHRWIDLALDCGVEYFEIPHFFTQWGSKAAPKFVVKVNGRNKKLFGWHTEALGEEYTTFLSQFIPALLAEFKKRGLDKKCFFHVSDEPNTRYLEHYTRCKNLIAQYLDGCPIIDALSDFEFYSTGALEKPASHTNSIMPFIEAGVPGLWAYYAGGGEKGVSDRSIAMPSHRTRVLGVQLYYYHIEGFLHWGYNFYNSRYSHSVLDPFGYADSGFFTPGGNSFLVYPGADGTAWESLRLYALRAAMDDMRALRLYEEKFGKEATHHLILEGTDGELTFTHYPTDPDYLPNLREKIARAFVK
jgi:hypothetical protein